MNRLSKSPSSAVWRCVQRLVRRLSAWALRDELRLQQNVNEDAQALVDALLRGERPDAYCGYGRDLQASNYRDELKWSLHELNKQNISAQTPRLVRYSEDVQEDATGQFYIHPIKVRLAEKINLGLSNRDGEIMIGKGVNGRCYLIAEADTYHNTEVFEGLGSTEHIEITAEAFLSLANAEVRHRDRERQPAADQPPEQP